ncbi:MULTISPECIES: PH domain-containing protein [Microbacterium]|uniref:PH domain-containing protein n=1 Tax=Microbacterium TaxID=33882 RepID=UPI000D64AA0C|nr:MULTISPECIES: PH domain-containing protein [Microbacterium]
MVQVRKVGDVEVYERLRFVPLTVGAAASGAVLAILPALDVRYLKFSAGLGLVLWLLWAVGVWPRVAVDTEGVLVRNTFTTSRFSFAALDGVSSGLALDFMLKGGRRVRAWAVPGHQNLGMEAIRSADAHAAGFNPVRRVSELTVGSATTPAGQVATSIARRLAVAEAQTGAAVMEADPGMLHRPNVAMIVVTGLLLAVAVAAVVAT